MAAQEASGYGSGDTLEAGAMREVSAWETEVEGMMREMVRRVEGEDSDLWIGRLRICEIKESSDSKTNCL